MRLAPSGKFVLIVLISILIGLKCFLICFWCFLLGAAVRAQNGYYAPQTFRQQLDGFQRGLFTPASKDGISQSTAQVWTPAQAKEPWKDPSASTGPVTFRPEPWRSPYSMTKEQQASILHHKQALTSEGAFRFEYASDNGLAAGEQIEPDGSRVGAYQYKDPSGQLVKLKYRAGKDGFQILEGSHLPKSPEPVAPNDAHYDHAYVQQRQQYALQQEYNQQRFQQGNSGQAQGEEASKAAGGQYFNQNWRSQGGSEDDGQYRENDVENKGPHSFGEGYAFAFKG